MIAMVGGDHKKGSNFYVLIILMVMIASMPQKLVAAAETWTETDSAIYTTDPTKNVGIGTADPQANLAIQGKRFVVGSNAMLGNYSPNDAAFEFQNPDGSVFLNFVSKNGGMVFGSSTFDGGQNGLFSWQHPFVFYMEGKEVWRIDPATSNVGIGTTAPQAALHVGASSGVLFTGSYGSGSIPVEGEGTRLLWYPGKAAVRAGYAASTQWDDANIGGYSTAFGFSSIASGQVATSIGYETTASGTASIALGLSTTASGNASVALGQSSSASENYATALGSGTTATKAYATAMGYGSVAAGEKATALGHYTFAQSYSSVAIGQYNEVAGNQYSWVGTDPLFVIGNGVSSAERHNAITLLKNGNIGIGITKPVEALDVAGDIQASGIICDSNGCIGDTGGSTGESIWNTSGTSIYYNSGNVGIGTGSPSYTLDVVGYIRGQSGLCIGTDCRTSWPSSGTSGITGSGSSNYLTKWTDSGSVGNASIYETGGNVGIGTTSPGAKLDVQGSVNISGLTNIIQAANNWGLRVLSATGDDDEGGIYGEASSTGGDNTTGVWGVVKAYGNADGQPIGVRGDATSSDPVQGQFGVLGYNYARTQDAGMVSAGVWGGSVGIPGQEGDFSGIGSGVVGETHSTYNFSAGGVFYAKSTTGEAEGVATKTWSSDPDSFALYASGKTGGSSAKVSLVNTTSRGPVEFYGIESPEAWFEDYGTGRLRQGRATIALDPIFQETVTIDEQHPMHVFIQPYGDADLYVKRDVDSFTVLSHKGSQKNVAFSYRIVAKRRHFEDERLRRANVTIDQFMEPNLSLDELKALNQRWNLPLDMLEPPPLPSQQSVL